MAATNTDVYAKAGEIARLAMGREEKGSGHWREPVRWKADSDPLAWWCLVELLVNFRNWKPKP